MKITGKELAMMGRNGHRQHFTGTGIHISRKQKPKGNRSMLIAKAIKEW